MLRRPLLRSSRPCSFRFKPLGDYSHGSDLMERNSEPNCLPVQATRQTSIVVCVTRIANQNGNIASFIKL